MSWVAETRLTRWFREHPFWPYIRSQWTRAAWVTVIMGGALLTAWITGEIAFVPGALLGIALLVLTATFLAWLRAWPFSDRRAGRGPRGPQ
jgi:hypothetical protein